MKKLSLRRLIPNLFIFISLTLGLTSQLIAIDEKWQIAVSLIVLPLFSISIDAS